MGHGTARNTRGAEGLPQPVLEETCRLQWICEKRALALAPRNNLPQYEMEREWKGLRPGKSEGDDATGISASGHLTYLTYLTWAAHALGENAEKALGA